LVAGAVFATAARLQVPGSPAVMLTIAAGHALLGGVGSALAVVRYWPFERGRACRAAGAFVFGVLGTFVALLFFGCCFSVISEPQ
jgi:hypothetical protein